MPYGLRCFSASGYLTFDSAVMPNYLKTSASGAVTLAGGATSAAIAAADLDYVYVYFSTPAEYVNERNADRYEVLSQTATSFAIKNISARSETFYYVAFVR